MRSYELHGFCRGVYLSDIGSVHMVEKFTNEDKFLKRLFKECLKSQWSYRPFFFGVISKGNQIQEKRVLMKIGAKFHKFTDDYDCEIFTFTRKDLIDFIRDRNENLRRRFASNQVRPLEVPSNWIGYGNLPLFRTQQAQDDVNNQTPIRVGDRVTVGEGTTVHVVSHINFDVAFVRSELSGYNFRFHLNRLRRI